MEKIEAIRQKPEQIRRRYVWFWVVVTMAFVITIWIISLRSIYTKSAEPMDFGTGGITNEYGDSKEMIQDMSDSIKKIPVPENNNKTENLENSKQ